MNLQWRELVFGHNSHWEADSAGTAGCRLVWRVVQTGPLWHAGLSDPELIGDESIPMFRQPGPAKAWCERRERELS